MIDGYGMGIFPYDFDNVKGYGHGGRVEEFYSWTWYYPDKKLAISYITNGILSWMYYKKPFYANDINDIFTLFFFDPNFWANPKKSLNLFIDTIYQHPSR